MRTVRGNRVIGAVVLAAVCGVAVACTAPTPAAPTTTITSVPGPPVVNRLWVAAKRLAAPIVGTLSWSIGDPNGDVLRCRVDTDGDGTFDRSIDPCGNSDLVLVSVPDAGARTFTLEVADATSAPVTSQTTLTAVAAAPGGFQITLLFDDGLAPEYRTAFDSAAARWSQVITADVPGQQAEIPEGFLGWMPGFSGVVDDVLILARSYEIDGVGGTLGRAGALQARPSNGLPYVGVMEFDTADLARLATSGRLGSVIQHEMGHVLGLGSGWVLQGLVDDALSEPRYNAPGGVAAWQELGGTGRVPVENQGGAGTALAHWRESTFGNELMTGYSDPDERLSRLTVAALADQGYGVDLGAADRFSLPVGSALRAPQADIGHTDPVVLLPPGTFG